MASAFWSEDGVEFPDALTVYDHVTIDGTEIDCPVKIVPRQNPALRLNTKKPPGFDGEHQTPEGYIAATFGLKFLIWTKRQDAVVENLIEKVWRKPYKDFRGTVKKGTQPVYTIAHPSLSKYGITEITVTEAGLPVDEQGPQEKSITIYCRQYLPPNKQKPSPSSLKESDATVDPHLKNNNRPVNQAGKPPSASVKPKKRS
jgi:hypothetical protein